MKWIMLVVVSVMLACGTASAEQEWTDCTARQVGQDGDNVRVELTDCNLTGVSGWYSIKDEYADRIMATIMVAMSLEQPVAVVVDWETKDSDGYSYVTSALFNNTKKIDKPFNK